MFERILVPLDGSELAERAIPYAEEMAAKFGSEVDVVTAGTLADNMEHPEYRIYLSKITALMEQNIKKAVVPSAAKKVKVTSDLIGASGLTAHPAEEIIDYADKHDIKLIIMATHGRTGITRWVMGDTANKVAQSFKCPLLLIRAKGEKPASIRLEKILVPIDGSKESESVLPYIEALSLKFKPEINLLNIVQMLFHVYAYPAIASYGGAGIVRIPYNPDELKPFQEAAEKYISGVVDKFKQKGIKVNHEIRTGDPAEEIIEAEDAIHPDLVAMSSHGHSGFGRFDHGSIADKVLHAGNAPILLVRPRKS